MIIERTEDEVILRLPADIDVSSLQRILDYLKYKEAISKSQGTEEQALELGRELKRNWWEENKEKYNK